MKIKKSKLWNCKKISDPKCAFFFRSVDLFFFINIKLAGTFLEMVVDIFFFEIEIIQKYFLKQKKGLWNHEKISVSKVWI